MTFRTNYNFSSKKRSVKSFISELPEVEFKFYCEKIEELECNDPLVIDLHLFKSGSDLKKLKIIEAMLLNLK